MRPESFKEDAILSFLKKTKLSTLEELKNILGSTCTMTIFRKLKSLGYITSYSHRGKYYTLSDIPVFNALGLWNCHSTWFSRYGNLIETVREFIEESESGFSVKELEAILHVEVRQCLLKLHREKMVCREKTSGVYLYFSRNQGKKRSQVLRRKDSIISNEIEVYDEVEKLSHEFKAAIILFFSMLDERQRRLFAGLESQKLGHGGDLKIAELLGLHANTVARGREEIFGGVIDRHRIRKEGSGRRRVEKKLLK